MPLDAQSEAILANRRKAGIVGVAKLTAAEVRSSRAAYRALNPDATIPVHATRDFAVPVAGGSMPVRVYWPGPEKNLPAAAYFHGGGWVIGDLDHSDGICRALSVQSGAIVVNVDYRLAPEHKYPTAAEDAYASVAWMAAHAAELGADPGRLAVSGASAGGNLAAAAALIARDRGGPALAAQLLVYPVTDIDCDAPSFVEHGEGYVVSTEDMRWYWRQYLAAPEHGTLPYASPLRADVAGLPPALVITAEYDCIRDDGERYALRLAEAGVPVALTRYPGTLHGFFSMAGPEDGGTRAIAEGAAFLRACLFPERAR